MKATEQYFLVVLFIMLYKVAFLAKCHLFTTTLLNIFLVTFKLDFFVFLVSQQLRPQAN